MILIEPFVEQQSDAQDRIAYAKEINIKLKRFRLLAVTSHEKEKYAVIPVVVAERYPQNTVEDITFWVRFLNAKMDDYTYIDIFGYVNEYGIHIPFETEEDVA